MNMRVALLFVFFGLVSCISDAERQSLLTLHNSGRACTRTQALVWDSAAETVAQNYANGCQFGHNGARSDQYKTVSGKTAYVGENIAQGTASAYGVDRLFMLWWNEKSQYACGTTISGSNFGAFGHYTQIAWEDTTSLGCGVAICGSNRYVVCNYVQGGNYIGETPFPASSCNPSCEASLTATSTTTSQPLTSRATEPPSPSLDPTIVKTSTTSTTVAPTSQVTSTTAAPTSAPPATSQPVGPVPEVKVLVTVSLPKAPNIVDINTFTSQLSEALGIPQDAITEIQIDLDQSTSSTTIIHFTMSNVEKSDGSRVDPVAAAYALKDLANGNGGNLSRLSMLKDMQVMSVNEQSASASSDGGDFTKSVGFIIMIAVIGGVIVVAALVAVTIIVVKKKRSNAWF